MRPVTETKWQNMHRRFVYSDVFQSTFAHDKFHRWHRECGVLCKFDVGKIDVTARSRAHHSKLQDHRKCEWLISKFEECDLSARHLYLFHFNNDGQRCQRCNSQKYFQYVDMENMRSIRFLLKFWESEERSSPFRNQPNVYYSLFLFIYEAS